MTYYTAQNVEDSKGYGVSSEQRHVDIGQ